MEQRHTSLYIQSLPTKTMTGSTNPEVSVNERKAAGSESLAGQGNKRKSKGK